MMIYIILGGIGSGKSLTAVKNIKESDSFFYTNFHLKHMKGRFHRIKYDDIITTTTEDKKTKKSVNWLFWDDQKKKHPNFSICIDEIHNIIHARRSMSKDNILMSKWVSQIRKILSDSPHNHLYIISQTMRKIDVDFRELAQVVIKCDKIEIGKKVYIVNTFYQGIEGWEFNKRSFRTVFEGKKYFKFYDSLELIHFSDEGVYI